MLNQLGTKILTIQEVMQGAERTQALYLSCISDTAQSLKSINPSVDEETLYSFINKTCEYSEGQFSLYNILIASNQMNKAMSEKDAAQFLERAYATKGREASNQDIRTKIFKALNLLSK